MDHKKNHAYENEEDKRLALIVSTIIWATWVGYLFVLILGIFFHDNALIVLTLVGSVLLVVPMVQLRQQKLQASSLWLVVIELATLIIIATVGQGIRDLALLGIPIIILFAGLVLDKVFFRISIGLMLVAVLWLSFGENFGWFITKPFEGEMENWFYLVGVIIIMLLAALAVDMLSKNMRANLVRARNEIAERKLAEEKIRQLNATLEQRVEERTSALQDAQEQLLRKEKLATLGMLAGSVGHELRNPLGVINTSIYYLNLVQPQADEKIKQHHAMIQQEVRNADKIISDLLDFGRNINAERELVSVPEIVQRTLERFPVPASVEVKLEFPADLPKVFADPHQVEQILGNLTTNASQVMVSEGTITNETNNDSILTISGIKQMDMVVISIKDTGLGISPENIKKIFEPLFSTKTKGIGLGLAVSRKMAEANGGGIEVESELGKGSTFKLYVPVGEI